MDIYKYFFVKNPKFGIDLFHDGTIIEDIVLLEKDIHLTESIPIKFNFYALLLCIDGKLIRNVNQYNYTIMSHTLQLIPPNTIYSFKNISDTTQVYILLFTESYIKSEKEEHVTENVQTLFNYHNSDLSPIELSTLAFARILNLYNDINNELYEKQDGYHSLIRLIILKLLLLLKREKNNQNRTKIFLTRAEQLTNLYLELIENHFIQYRKIADYAKLLDITSKHLGETIKEVTGKSALSYIHDRMLKEALYLLQYTNLSISQISSILSFEHPSKFSRFFKTHYKMTPTFFRLRF